MDQLADRKRAAIRYWEFKRIIYNSILIAPALLGYSSMAEFSAAVGDRRYIGDFAVLLLFIVSAVGANFCFSLVYAGEFLWGEARWWMKGGRTLLFIAGTLFSIFLAFIVSRNIGYLQYAPVRIF